MEDSFVDSDSDIGSRDCGAVHDCGGSGGGALLGEDGDGREEVGVSTARVGVGGSDAREDDSGNGSSCCWGDLHAGTGDCQRVYFFKAGVISHNENATQTCINA